MVSPSRSSDSPSASNCEAVDQLAHDLVVVGCHCADRVERGEHKPFLLLLQIDVQHGDRHPCGDCFLYSGVPVNDFPGPLIHFHDVYPADPSQRLPQRVALRTWVPASVQRVGE